MNCVPVFDFKMPDLKRPLELLVWCGTRTSQKPPGNEVFLLDFLMFSRVDVGYFSVPYLSRFSRFALTLIKKISATYLGDVWQLRRLDFKSKKRRINGEAQLKRGEAKGHFSKKYALSVHADALAGYDRPKPRSCFPIILLIQSSHLLFRICSPRGAA